MLPKIDIDAGLRILERGNPRARAAIDKNRQAAEKLVRFVGFHPLALVCTGSLLDRRARMGRVETAVTILLNDFKNRRLSVLDLRLTKKRPGFQKEDSKLIQVLALNYDLLPDDETKRAFRELGRFGPPPSSFSLEQMAEAWATDANTTEELAANLLEANLIEKAQIPDIQETQPAPETRYVIEPLLAELAEHFREREQKTVNNL
jgi:hypothetical protein